MKRIFFVHRRFLPEDLLIRFTRQKIVNNRRTAVALGIIHITHALHRHFLTGVRVIASHPRIKHPLFDQQAISLAVSIADLEQEVILAIKNLAADRIAMGIHAVNGAHHQSSVRAVLILGQRPVVAGPSEAGARTIGMTNDPHVGSLDLILSRLRSGRRKAQQQPREQRDDFPSCQSMHDAQSRATPQTVQAANPTMLWKSRHKTLDLSHQAEVMGILNITPDSFSDGGCFNHGHNALGHARQLIAEGAAIIDVGGESTRPGATPVSTDEEIARTVPVIAALRKEWSGSISIDTTKAAVAAAAIAAGADIVNDISGLRADHAMAGLCAESGCAVVVMHMQGQPQTMQEAPQYDDVVAEVRAFFDERLTTLTQAGISADAICFDPGIGFGKSLDHNLALLRSLDSLCPAGRPLLLGLSRKSFIGQLLGDKDLTLRDWPTLALCARAREQGVMLHRVHQVRPNLEALRMIEAVVGMR